MGGRCVGGEAAIPRKLPWYTHTHTYTLMGGGGMYGGIGGSWLV